MQGKASKQLVRAFCNDPLYFALFILDADALVLRSLYTLVWILALPFVLLRLVWGVAGTRHARLSDFSLSPAALVGYLRGVLAGQVRTWAGHNPASSWAALVMMGLGLGMAA